MRDESIHRLTIAYDAKRAFLNYRGLGNYSRNLLSQMAHYYGESRYLLCTPEKKDSLYPWLDKAPFECITPNGLWRLSPSLWRRCGIPKTLSDKKVDIYHGLSQELPEGIERLGCKTVVTMHDAIFMRYPELYSPTYRASFIRRNRSACKRADLIIAISEQTKRDFIEFFGVDESRIKVVYQGCSDVFWQPCTAEQRQRVKELYHLPSKYILCVGALEERKNQLRLIEAIASTQIKIPLVLVGRGNEAYKKQLKESAVRYGVSLLLIENATTEHMPAIYHQALVFVYPSLFEGFGIPVLEAARCQIPIVASQGTCFEEITGEGAVYVNPLRPEEIGDSICNTLQQTEQTTLRVQSALRNTEKFRAEKIAHSLMEVYLSLGPFPHK